MSLSGTLTASGTLSGGMSRSGGVSGSVSAGQPRILAEGILKGDGTGNISAARSGFDYAAPIKDEAEGAVAHFIDGAAGPVDDFTIDINPVQAGTGTPSPTNVRAISGWTGANVFKAGKNLLDQSKYLTSTTTTQGLSLTWNSDGSISFANTSTNTSGKVTQLSDPFYLPAGTYYFSGAGVSANVYLRLRGYTNGTATSTIISGDGEFTLTEGSYVDLAVFIRANSVSGMTYSPMICTVSGASYEPYAGTTKSISFGQTVYKGQVDVTTGVLTVTHKLATFDGTEGWGGPEANGNIYLKLSNTNKMADRMSGALTSRVTMNLLKTGDTAVGYGYVSSGGYLNCKPPDISTLAGWTTLLGTTNLQVYYPLDTAVTYQLTPTQVTTLLGENNIWADTGNSKVKFYADTKLYIQQLTQPTEDDMTANANIASGKYFMVGNNLYYSTASIANGAKIIVGTNCNQVTLAAALNAINS